ncbi:MAG: dTDP-glucose 4,6-dehydratase [Oligoflexia bacterium]|nr:dTDP-glucose 4,6-dehydratase [Oligoflexia bacterium]
MKRVLVTGAAGFIGSAFVRLLLDKRPDLRITSLDVLTGAAGLLANLDGLGAASHRLVQGDVCNRALLDSLLADEDIDTIVHFAAESHVDRSIDGPGAFVRTNVQGTWTLLDAARQRWLRSGHDGAGCRFHQVSTDEVFGDRQHIGDATEDSPFRPRSPYAASKAAADHLVRSYQHTYGLPVSITFACNNLGPRQHPEKLVPLVILRALAGQTLPLYGDGTAVRRWIHVDDHCRAVLAVLDAGQAGRAYAVGPLAGTSNLDLVQRLCARLDQIRPAAAPHADLIRFVKDRPGHDQVYRTSADRLRTELGWRPRLDLDQALDLTLAWYLDHPDWIRKATARPAWSQWLSTWYGDERD